MDFSMRVAYRFEMNQTELNWTGLDWQMCLPSVLHASIGGDWSDFTLFLQMKGWSVWVFPCV